MCFPFFSFSFQFYSMNAFWPSLNGINRAYVDGISITIGSPRKHVWTYAIGISRDHNYPDANCPCHKYSGPQPPSFVGNDYYCESGATGIWTGNNRWLTNHRLWDGRNCSSEETKCCSRQNGTPYFTKSLGKFTTDRLEVRLCSNADTGNEDVGLERMVLYVR